MGTEPIFFIQIVERPATFSGIGLPCVNQVTILKSVRIRASVSCDAVEKVETIVQTIGKTAVIRIAHATTAVISIIAETKVSEAKVSNPL